MLTGREVINVLQVSLANLAAEPDDQLRYLHSIGQISCDELALELGEALDLTWISLEAGTVTPKQLALANQTRATLRTFSGPEHRELWTENGLRHRAEWASLRALAKEALRALVN